MKNRFFNFLIGFAIGSALSMFFLNVPQQQAEINENMSLKPPQELPQNIEFVEIDVPKTIHLQEVIL